MQRSVRELEKYVRELERELRMKNSECDAYRNVIDQRLSIMDQLGQTVAVKQLRIRLREDMPVDIDLDPILSKALRNFFHVAEKAVLPSSENNEMYLYDQFMLFHPKEQGGKVMPDQYTRDEVARAMHIVCGCPSDFEAKKRHMQAQHGENVRVCRKSFARCLAALGGVAKCVHGVNYWINVGMRRKPYYAWSI